jgi:hypothetical protein
MTKLKSTYNFIFLLIIVSAFPVSIAASHDQQNTDSLICKFHETQTNNNFAINCDHCNYFFDVAPSLSEKTIYVTSHISLLKISARNSFTNFSYIFNSSRSPPIS